MPFGRTQKKEKSNLCTLLTPHCRFDKLGDRRLSDSVINDLYVPGRSLYALENDLGHGLEVGLEAGHNGVTG